MEPNIKLEQHPFVKKLVRNIEEGDFLFQQGQMGNTIFLILSGTVSLISLRNSKECFIQNIEAGEFIGEKAMIQAEPFKRFSSAKAVTTVTALELGLNEVTQLEKEAPALLQKLIKKAFRVAAARIDSLNQLVSLLRASDPNTSFLGYLQHICKTQGKKTLKGIQIQIDRTNIYYYLDMKLEAIDAAIAELISKKILIKEKDNLYTVPDADALLQVEMYAGKAA